MGFLDIFNTEIAMEAVSEITTFIDDPMTYLLNEFNRSKNKSPRPNDILLSDVIHVDGKVYAEINKAGSELRKVNAYSEAISLYDKAISTIEGIMNEIPSKEKEIVEYTINELKMSLLDTIKERDDYTSRRKSIIAKYSILFDKI